MSASLADVFEGYLDLRYRIDPVEGTRAGRRELDGLYGAYDAASVRAHIAALRSYTGALEETAAGTLDEEIDQTAALHDARHLLLVFERLRPFARDPGFHLAHAMDGIQRLVGDDRDDAGARAAALAARLRALPELFAAAAVALTEPVRPLADAAAASLPVSLTMLDGLDGVLAPAVADAADRAALIAAARDALVGFGDVLSLMDERDAFRDQAGVGRDLFERLLHTAHMIQDGADQLFRWAEDAHREARTAIEAMVGSGADGDRGAAPSSGGDASDESLRRVYEDELDAVRRFIARHDIIRDTGVPVRIVPTPAYLRASIPLAAYDAAGPSARRQAGTLYVTRAPSGPALSSVVTHEVVPGHHHQMAVASALPQVMRRVVASAAAREGWACYGDQAMDESGFFATPEATLMRARDASWRTARVMLDVSLHVRGMTPSAAERWMRDAIGVDAAFARSEVVRACARPTHLSAGAVGQREILALRRDARRAWGGDFSLPRFHDELLRYGAYPTALARWGMGLA